tara:strand:- start:124839 stop:125045 length:207 start_codon:yes stop_codon:yes gene_type:complete
VINRHDTDTLNYGGPLLNVTVTADSKKQIEDMFDKATGQCFELYIKEFEPDGIDALKEHIREFEDRYL